MLDLLFLRWAPAVSWWVHASFRSPASLMPLDEQLLGGGKEPAWLRQCILQIEELFIECLHWLC